MAGAIYLVMFLCVCYLCYRFYRSVERLIARGKQIEAEELRRKAYRRTLPIQSQLYIKRAEQSKVINGVALALYIGAACVINPIIAIVPAGIAYRGFRRTYQATDKKIEELEQS